MWALGYFRSRNIILQFYHPQYPHPPPCYQNSTFVLRLADWLLMLVHTLQCNCECVRPRHTKRAENMIGWPLKSTLINANDRYSCFMKCHGHCFPLLPPPLPLLSSFPLSVPQHGHIDGSLSAVSPEHLWRHSISAIDMDCWSGWCHAVPPDCSNVLLLR